jgi:rRNA maturation RNase YbeY
VVNIFFEDTEVLDLNPEFFVSWLSEVCVSHCNLLGEVSLIFCSDEYLLELNRTHLDHDYYTDIITFDYSESDVSGDLFVSIDRVRENAEVEKVEFLSELNRVVVHGVLHLLGFKDKTNEESTEMKAQENKALEIIVSRET